MNNQDQFEQRLRRQPLREIPSAWRGEILAAAGANRRNEPARELTLAALLKLRLRELLWPAPQAWAALAAIWLVLLGASLGSYESSSATEARRFTPLSPEVRQLLKQQEQLLAELVGPSEKSVADRPKSFAPQPRSEFREPWMNA
ncbi:MAG: hypothetical protein ACRD5L_14185 [Bryobacteraceae bacterium]